ncbi:MAG: ATP-binding protein [Anaerolineae bacterium]|nr:ATP-binding protein [Anaerolineae bacterium]
MFNLPIEEITFDALKEFCIASPPNKEDLDLDYKVDWPSDLAKILCSMANVQGGMVIIGVNTKEGTREPDWPPAGVEGTEDELRQRAIQIAYDGIYPPIIDLEVQPVLIPDSDRMVVVIRIDPSDQMHATDGRKKIYVRVADHSRKYDYRPADISELEWLWNKRNKSIELRNHLTERAYSRSHALNNSGVVLHLSIVPAYPSGEMRVSPAKMLSSVLDITPIKVESVGYFATIPAASIWRELNQGWRTVPDGIASKDKYEEKIQYVEIGTHQMLYLSQNIPTARAYSDNPNSRQCIDAEYIATILDAFIILGGKVVDGLQWRGQLILSAKLVQFTEGCALSKPLKAQSQHGWKADRHTCPDIEIELAELRLNYNSLTEKRLEIFETMMCNLFWAFGYPYNKEDFQNWIKRISGKKRG